MIKFQRSIALGFAIVTNDFYNLKYGIVLSLFFFTVRVGIAAPSKMQEGPYRHFGLRFVLLKHYKTLMVYIFRWDVKRKDSDLYRFRGIEFLVRMEHCES